MTWSEIADDNWKAANELRSSGRERSCVSRAYYSAWAEATAALEGKVKFADDREGPPHLRLPELVCNNLGLERNVGQELRKALKRLYSARLHADYRTLDLDEKSVTAALRDANLVRKTLGARNA